MGLLLARARLWCEIALHRHGWMPPAALIALSTSFALEIAWLEPARIRQEALRQELGAREAKGRGDLSRLVAPAPAPENSNPLQALRTVMPAASESNKQLAGVFDLAEQAGVRLDKSSYEYPRDSQQPWTRVAITLPVSGTYPQVRTFVEAVLRSSANMSLDQLSIKREGADKSQADVQLVFSAWYAPAPQTDVGGKP
jgi:Tfp pilus assembly protein PilO